MLHINYEFVNVRMDYVRGVPLGPPPNAAMKNKIFLTHSQKLKLSSKNIFFRGIIRPKINVLKRMVPFITTYVYRERNVL